LLIDDNEDHYYKWMDAGGWAVLFPAPWNSNDGIKDPVGYTMEHVTQIMKIVGSMPDDS
jgi:hypothetical protein